jgi:CheY-like chemotaxis protein
VSEAVDGKDGLAKVGAGKFDLIITDLNMPNVDGIQLITAVRKLPGYSLSRGNRLDCEAFQCRSVDCRGAKAGQVTAQRLKEHGSLVERQLALSFSWAQLDCLFLAPGRARIFARSQWT